MTYYKKEEELIFNCKNIKDKLLVFTIYSKLYDDILTILASDYPVLDSKYSELLTAYLKVYIESLDKDKIISTEEFFRNFIKGVKLNKISENPQIEELLEFYSDMDIDIVKECIPYVETINNQAKLNEEKKRELVLFVREFISKTFLNILIKVHSSNKSLPQIENILNYMNITLIKRINERLPKLLENIDSLYTFEFKLAETACDFILEENSEFEPLLKSIMGEFTNTLDGINYEIFKMQTVMQLVTSSDDINIMTNKYISEKLHIEPQELSNILLELEFLELEYESNKFKNNSPKTI